MDPDRRILAEEKYGQAFEGGKNIVARTGFRRDFAATLYP